MATKQCKYCRSEIDKKASVCPHCQKKQGGGCLSIIGAVCIIILALLFIPIFAKGCSDGYNEEKNRSERSSEEEQKTSVTMTGHHLTKNSAGDSILVVDYDFYNGEDEPKNFTWTVNDKCFQNGVECQEEYFLDEVDTSKQTADIQPGITLNLSVAYKLSGTSDVNIVVTKLIGDDEFINETFSIQ